jgi:molybdate transport system substrate-binding protein
MWSFSRMPPRVMQAVWTGTPSRDLMGNMVIRPSCIKDVNSIPQASAGRQPIFGKFSLKAFAPKKHVQCVRLTNVKLKFTFQSLSKMKFCLSKIFFLGTLFVMNTDLRAADVTVFAAASLTDSLKVMAATYEKASGDKIIFNFAASSTLARQITAGAPADIFFSADEAQMDKLAKQGLIDPATRQDRLGNTLVVVIPMDSTLKIQSPGDLTNAGVKQIALADPQGVPAGVYAKAWLENLHLWQLVEPKVVPTENVRAALAAVASGNVDAGVVYKTDAAISQQVRIAYEVPRAGGPDIRYPLALVKNSQQPEAAKRFLHYLSSKEAGQVFTQYGFLLRE